MKQRNRNGYYCNSSYKKLNILNNNIEQMEDVKDESIKNAQAWAMYIQLGKKLQFGLLLWVRIFVWLKKAKKELRKCHLVSMCSEYQKGTDWHYFKSSNFYTLLYCRNQIIITTK